ncbi:MAG: hypothetical protein AAGK30_16120 [Pseudomonadota bacterium]
MRVFSLFAPILIAVLIAGAPDRADAQRLPVERSMKYNMTNHGFAKVKRFSRMGKSSDKGAVEHQRRSVD